MLTLQRFPGPVVFFGIIIQSFTLVVYRLVTWMKWGPFHGAILANCEMGPTAEQKTKVP